MLSKMVSILWEQAPEIVFCMLVLGLVLAWPGISKRRSLREALTRWRKLPNEQPKPGDQYFLKATVTAPDLKDVNVELVLWSGNSVSDGQTFLTAFCPKMAVDGITVEYSIYTIEQTDSGEWQIDGEHVLRWTVRGTLPSAIDGAQLHSFEPQSAPSNSLATAST